MYNVSNYVHPCIEWWVKRLENNQKKPCNRKLLRQQGVLLYLHDLIYILALIILLFLLVFRIVVVSGSSMENTLQHGDYLLLVGNLFYTNMEQGDIIVASKDSFEDGAPIVKRIIATEGQTVDIDCDTGLVYVDGIPLKENYTSTKLESTEGGTFPQTVQPGCVFVMGDNRGISKDSRSPEIGQIDKREILGKVVFLLLPGHQGSAGALDLDRIGVIS